MVSDAYLHADGEVEAEHVWVNEWAEARTGRPAAVAPERDTPAEPGLTLAAASAVAGVPRDSPETEPTDQLMRDIVEIEFARSMLEKEPLQAPPLPRTVPRAPLAVGGAFGLVMLTVLGVIASLVRVPR